MLIDAQGSEIDVASLFSTAIKAANRTRAPEDAIAKIAALADKYPTDLPRGELPPCGIYRGVAKVCDVDRLSHRIRQSGPLARPASYARQRAEVSIRFGWSHANVAKDRKHSGLKVRSWLIGPPRRQETSQLAIRNDHLWRVEWLDLNGANAPAEADLNGPEPDRPKAKADKSANAIKCPQPVPAGGPD